ncbi:MAG: DUF433 domain-containing protein [Acidobacteriota bacterium]
MVAIETVQAVPLTQLPNGAIRVAGTRVSLDTILYHYKQGASAEEITNRFPAVPLEKVYAVIAYYLSHQTELDAYLQQQEEEEAAFMKQLEADPQYQAERVALRERLMRRWDEMQKNRQ